MPLRHSLFTAAVFAAAVLPVRAADPPALADGKYTLTYASGAAFESHLAILKLSAEGEKSTATVVATPPPPKPPTGQPARRPQKVTVGEPKLEGGLLTFTVDVGQSKYTFEGKLDPADPKRVLGSLEIRGFNYRAALVATDKDELGDDDSTTEVKLPDELQQANKLRSEPSRLQSVARKEKDADKRQELLTKAKAAKKEADAKVPGLWLKVVAGNPDPAVGYHTTLDLLNVVAKTTATPAEVRMWADVAVAFAATHGPRYERYTVSAVAVALAAQAGFGEVALPFAERNAAAASPAPADQVKALNTLAAAQRLAGQADAEKATRAKVEVLNAELDAEYKKTTPGFPVEKYAGRKNPEANRVAVLELFTGTQCPPCVAADIAFDALELAYPAKDVVLVQYHQHVPGPDPLTNTDTIARWDYYSKLFPDDIRGVPSALFNGTPKGGGGGARETAQEKYDEYAKLIGPILEQKTPVTVEGSAVLADGAVTVDARVGGVEKADRTVVRVLLAEEEVKYPGGNGIRFHHQVVRSAFGQPDGWGVKDGKVSASVKLDDLKKGLADYLEGYHTNERPFALPDRPLDLKHLRVIVLVQDDETGEILNAVQFDVTGGKQ